MEQDLIAEYMEILEKKDADKAKEFVEKHFGVETDEDFKKEEYLAFASRVAVAVIEKQSEEQALEAKEEEAKDEAES